MTRSRGNITKLAKDNFQIRISYLEHGKRREYKRQGFATKGEAEIARANAIVTLGKGRSIDASRQTVESFLLSWYETYANSRTIKPSTLVTTATHIRSILIPYLGKKTLRELKPELIAKLYSDLLASGRVDSTRTNATPELSNKYVRNIAGTLSRALSDAVEWGLLPENPCSRVTLPRKTKPELVTLSGQEIAQFLNSAIERKDPMLSAWLLVFTTGMRRGELAGLRWKDVDFITGTATITQTRAVVGKQVLISTPKTKAGSRTIALDALTIDELARLKDAQEQAAETLGYWASDLVFTNIDGSLPSPNTLLKRFRRALELAELPKIRLHDGRHSYAAYALESGVSVHIVSPRLGHSSPSFTYDTYAKSIPAADRLAASVVEQALSKLIDADRGTRKGREVREKDAKITNRQEQENSLSPYNPIDIGLREHDEQANEWRRWDSNPRPPACKAGALAN
jgi:integrase